MPDRQRSVQAAPRQCSPRQRSRPTSAGHHPVGVPAVPRRAHPGLAAVDRCATDTHHPSACTDPGLYHATPCDSQDSIDSPRGAPSAESNQSRCDPGSRVVARHTPSPPTTPRSHSDASYYRQLGALVAPHPRSSPANTATQPNRCCSLWRSASASSACPAPNTARATHARRTRRSKRGRTSRRRSHARSPMTRSHLKLQLTVILHGAIDPDIVHDVLQHAQFSR